VQSVPNRCKQRLLDFLRNFQGRRGSCFLYIFLPFYGVRDGKVACLQNRHGRDITKRYPEIVGTHVDSKKAILDGEMIVFGDDNKPSFSKLAKRSHLEDELKINLLSNSSPATYIVFDLILYNGLMLDRMPLVKRKDILDSIVARDSGPVLRTFYVGGDGINFFDLIVGMGYEGIMAKKKDSYYLLGKRSDLWLKMKPQKSAICNVIGYTKGEGHRRALGALMIAQPQDNRLIDRGRVGSGISTRALGDLLGLLNPLVEKNGVTWVDPSLQIEVTYFEKTEGGHFRFPVFKRIVG